MKAPFKQYRIFASYTYLQPSYDEFGFPEESPLINTDTTVNIMVQEMGEMVAEIMATDADDLQKKIQRLISRNQYLVTIELHPDQAVVEL
jgi:hypothetical protein